MQKAAAEDVAEVVGWMTRLNRSAGQLAVESELACGTDVTGFSLLGHGWEMANAANVSLELEYHKIPFVSCARKYADMGAFAGGLFDNQAYFRAHVQFDKALDEPSQMLLFDPQTSGGLLLGVPKEKLRS